MEDKRINIVYIPGEDVVKVITTESHNDGNSGDICQSEKVYGDVTAMQERIKELENENSDLANELFTFKEEIEILRHYRDYWRKRALKAEALDKSYEYEELKNYIDQIRVIYRKWNGVYDFTYKNAMERIGEVLNESSRC